MENGTDSTRSIRCDALVDRVGHRLVKFSRVDLKQLGRDGGGVRRS